MWKCRVCGFVMRKSPFIDREEAYCMKCGNKDIKDFDPFFRENDKRGVFIE
jgi:hypothetical protein